MCVKTDALKIMIEQNFSKGLQEERIGAARSSCSWMIERVMELQPWRNSEPFVIDLLFDRVTMKLTGTILLKLTWISKVKKKKKEKDCLPQVEFRNYGGICFKFKDMNHKGVFSL